MRFDMAGFLGGLALIGGGIAMTILSGGFWFPIVGGIIFLSMGTLLVGSIISDVVRDIKRMKNSAQYKSLPQSKSEPSSTAKKAYSSDTIAVTSQKADKKYVSTTNKGKQPFTTNLFPKPMDMISSENIQSNVRGYRFGIEE